MKTLILYATKYGAATEIARRIAEKMDGAVIHDLKQIGIPDIAVFDCIIVGSSIYAGMFRKEAKLFLSQNADTLRQKKLGLYVSSISADEEQKVFADNVPNDVLQSAKAAVFLGGIYDPKKAGFAERLIMKAAAKLSDYRDTIDNDKIEKFAEGLKTR
ncbi:MAG: flavodoxin domain-containing protein [Defluviitaleaceae bacterium]|nr:flavodoxin domain-containing protein [Defluviitaleaceae bacterium]